MNRLKLDSESLGLSALMERVTGARVKDCFQDAETVYFVVAAGQIGKALGKGGRNVKRLQAQLAKRIKVIEFAEDLVRFVQNVIYPLKVEEIVQEENKIIIRSVQKKTKSLLIGRGGKHFESLKRAVNRFFNVEIKIE